MLYFLLSYSHFNECRADLGRALMIFVGARKRMSTQLPPLEGRVTAQERRQLILVLQW